MVENLAHSFNTIWRSGFGARTKRDNCFLETFEKYKFCENYHNWLIKQSQLEYQTVMVETSDHVLRVLNGLTNQVTKNKFQSKFQIAIQIMVLNIYFECLSLVLEG